MSVSRRDFLKTALLTAVAASFPMKVAAALVDKAEFTEDYATVVHENYVELVFFGTGINIITGPVDKIHVMLDGAIQAEINTRRGGVLEKRQFSPTRIHPIASGLPVGIHTVQLRFPSKKSVQVYGYEVIVPNGFERKRL